MARYIGPVCRLCRREAMKLFLKGERCLGRRERRSLARAFEADAAGARPRHHVAFRVGDGHRGVVEGGVNVRQAMVHDALLAALLERLLAFSGAFLFFLLRKTRVGGRFTLRH